MKLSNRSRNMAVKTSGEIIDIPNCWANIFEEKLKDMRLNAARIIELPAYCVFPNSTMQNIIKVMPQHINELWLVKGISDKILNSYGEDICDIFVKFFKLNDIEQILYGYDAFDLSSRKVRSILGYEGLLDLFDKNAK